MCRLITTNVKEGDRFEKFRKFLNILDPPMNNKGNNVTSSKLTHHQGIIFYHNISKL